MRAVLALLLCTGTAYAQPYDDAETEEALRALDRSDPANDAPSDEPAPEPTTAAAPPPPAPVRRAPGLALRPGSLVLTVTFEASLSKGTAFEPSSIAPDLAYGVTERLTLSLVHSGFAVTGFRGAAGNGVCISGDDGGCPRVYSNVGAEALVDVVRGPLAIAAVGGVHALRFDPTFVDVKLGAHAMYRAGRVTATFFPSVLVGVTERDAGNEGAVFLPASVGALAARRLFVALGGGVAAPLDNAGGAWTARVGAIARVQVAPSIFVAASLFLPKIAAGDDVMGTGADARTLNVWVTYAR